MLYLGITAPSDPSILQEARVDQIFELLDTDRSGLLSFAELRLLAEYTDGVAPTYEAFLRLSHQIGFNPTAGLDRAGLRKIYLELKLGDPRRDHALLTKCRAAELESARLIARQDAVRL